MECSVWMWSAQPKSRPPVRLYEADGRLHEGGTVGKQKDTTFFFFPHQCFSSSALSSSLPAICSIMCKPRYETSSEPLC